MPNRTPSRFLEMLRAEWPAASEGRALDSTAAAESVVGDEEQALADLRAMALWMAKQTSLRDAQQLLFRQTIGYLSGRAVRRWQEVMWALELATVAPVQAEPILRTLIVSFRLAVKGVVPALANLAGWGDATHELLPQIRWHMARLFERRQEVGWLLFRQLAKTLPHIGAQSDELHQARGASEELQWLLDCTLTMDIREQVHSRASPANLTLAQAYLSYLEEGDTAGLQALWLAQKIPAHDAKLAESPNPDNLRQRLIDTSRELVTILTRIYAFDPNDVNSVVHDAHLWLTASTEWLSEALHDRLEKVLGMLDDADVQRVVVVLTETRQTLGETIATATAEAGMNFLYLDLELEKLGYLLFGKAVHGDLETVTAETLPVAVETISSLIAAETIKGRGSPTLDWLSGILKEELADDFTQRMTQLLVLNHQVNDELSEVSLRLYSRYGTVVRDVLADCRCPNSEVAVNAFVDGLVRATTLQHLGELSLKLHHFVLGELERVGDDLARRVRAQVERYHRQYSVAASGVRAARGGALETPMWVYRFSRQEPGGEGHRTEVLGAKGANLCEMCRLGLPVPPGFVVTVGACERYMSIHALDPAVYGEIKASLRWLESLTGRTLGGGEAPLLVSVRSGAPVSMPGMLDTVLNVGMTDEVTHTIAERWGDERAALELYVRFLADYAGSVLSLSDLGAVLDASPSWDMVEVIKQHVTDVGLEPFWLSAEGQVIAAVEGVFRSWNNPHAVLFRRTRAMPHVGCTAATVQQMVFGNADDRSLTGVMFTHNPATGAEGLFGEYLPRAQGTDIVSGTRTPHPLTAQPGSAGESLEEQAPELVEELRALGRQLEQHYGAAQDIEFTVERGKLYLLQTRDAAPSAASEAAAEGPGAELSGAEGFRVIARGLGASPGGVFGRIALTAEALQELAKTAGATILVRPTTTPEDLGAMLRADGLLTARGGATSHAANNARYLGKPCVVGCQAMELDEAAGSLRIGEYCFQEGDWLFIDGLSGEVGVRPHGGDGERGTG